MPHNNGNGGIYKSTSDTVQGKMLTSSNDVSIKNYPEPYGDERIRVSSLVKDRDHLVESDGNGINTVATLFQAGLKIAGDKPCLGSRKSATDDYEWITYNEVDKQAKCIGSALQVKLEDSSFIAIRCKNRPEWSICAIGCAYYSFPICAINFTTEYKVMKNIITQAEFKVFISANDDDANWIIENHNEVPTVKLLVIMDINDKDIVTRGKDCGIEVLSFADLIPGKPEDLFTICYTSGTTGEPKGAMITNRSLISSICALSLSFPKSETSSTISYLPIAHLFEVCCELYVLKNGGKIGFYRGDIRGLMNDIETLGPTLFPVVPRLLNRIYLEVMNEVNDSYLKKYIMDWALKSKSDARKSNGRKTIWDSILFPRIRNKLGGNIETVLVASAPISTDVKAFFNCALDCWIMEAYGQTETSAATLTAPEDWDAGHVGFPQPNCLMKVVDVPEMEYFAKDDIGEICIKGPSLMSGYFKRDDLTAETIDKDGWLHTGDIGQWLPNGALKIIDRQKNIFKLSQGEYISPEKVENVYSMCNLTSQLFVDGISTENYCVALAVPNEPAFLKWAKAEGKEGSLEELCEDKAVVKLLIQELNKLGKKEGLNSLEQVKKVKILTKPFTMEDGLLTGTMKNKRIALRKAFDKEIKELYSEDNSN
ncbi:Long-chain-fatty-acid--CoA ligase 5 [Nymphon striatum]|nr:Long-chain-fatty-acid--CoA ligase 5 [Nymphon striatum]